jgi:hypothetical protein
MRFFRTLSLDFKAEDQKKVCNYFMRRRTLHDGPDKEELIRATLSEVPTAGTRASVRAEVDQNRLKYARLTLDVGGEQPIKRVGANWWAYLRLLHDLQMIEQVKALAVDLQTTKT